jgi:predicted small lipoprotein YifL
MNIKIIAVFSIILVSFSVSSCGMKRALTMPKAADNAQLAEDLAGHHSIDVLKTR